MLGDVYFDNAEEAFDRSPLPEDPAQRYVGTIDGCPLLVDAHGPYWLEGEPMTVTYEPDGGICIEEWCDLNQLPWWVRQPKPLDCGHAISGLGAYVTLLATGEDICVACAQEAR